MAGRGFAAILVAGLCGAALAVSGPAKAQVTLDGEGSALLQLGAGGYDIDQRNPAAVFRGEYRFASKLFVLTPLIGGEVTTDGSLYGYGGFGFDINFGSSWVLTPNAAVGAWSRGDGKNLGSGIEFRTGGELDYRFADQSRFGISFHHISNAGIGRHNPGEEELLALFSIPLNGP